MKVDSISRKVLNMILEASKDAHPYEFAAMLRADGSTITELILVPGTISGNSHAILRTHMLPIDFSVIGTVHSHPSPSARPSDADLQFFMHRGSVHMIVAFPYDESSTRFYDREGKRLDVPIV